jgi:LDH2 family malate/lactate/ureidoglycolate dehydrogenase
VAATVLQRYRLDDLRRFGAALTCAAGVAAARASSLASHLLWYDAAGAAPLGIATLPTWLETIEAGGVNPSATGQVVGERAALAILDGQNGLPPLILQRGAEIAVEKAREMAVGLVRVQQVGLARSAAAFTAGIAVGPMAGLAVGPNGLWSIALPSREGLPLVMDSGLWDIETPAKPGANRTKADSLKQQGGHGLAGLVECLAHASDILLPDGSWLMGAVSIAILEPLSTFHERVGKVLHEMADGPGRLLPATWEAQRRQAREHGIPIASGVWKELNQWAQRLAVEIPKPIAE